MGSEPWYYDYYYWDWQLKVQSTITLLHHDLINPIHEQQYMSYPVSSSFTSNRKTARYCH